VKTQYLLQYTHDSNMHTKTLSLILPMSRKVLFITITAKNRLSK